MKDKQLTISKHRAFLAMKESDAVRKLFLQLWPEEFPEKRDITFECTYEPGEPDSDGHFLRVWHQGEHIATLSPFANQDGIISILPSLSDRYEYQFCGGQTFKIWEK